MRRYLRTAYGGRTWARLLYLLVGAPLGVLGFAYLVVLLYVSGILLITLLGLPLLAAGLLGVRQLGTLHAILARGLLRVPVGQPAPLVRRPGLVGWIRSGLADTSAWRALAYLVTKLPLGLVGLATGLLFWGYGLAFLTYPIWWWLVPFPVSTDAQGHRRPEFFVIGDYHFNTWSQLVVMGVGGLCLLLAAPWVTRAVSWLDGSVLAILLGPTRASRLRQTRALAVDDAAARLRRIERDLHDGAQAQLVALAMKLGLAKEELAGGDTGAALALVDTAHAGAKQAIVELRHLARGIHPPVLDSGIGPALETLMARSAVPVEPQLTLAERPSPAIETIVYYSAAELLANIAKHSQARRAMLSLSAAAPGWLRLTVRDDGVGGIEHDHIRPGGGLTGLDERIRTVDGRLEISSPAGGPTVVSVELPVHA
jgi:signal transduction histidine kinase